ncbi:MAG: methionyl-tRNA formyltransferase [Alphaproteobacteria bacterium CG_4_9_14_3_um_filter_47_13]|nr:MAG: methionyl-tRNA formyltransferase [Alphaproteobacteria bacterium CG_4_9_14_3_um_filter_47_13]
MTEKKLRIAFMGTPDFAVPALKDLIGSGHPIVCVYTQPPRPKGRGYQVIPSPVHEVASTHGIPVFTPQSLKKDSLAQAQFLAHDLDLAIVAAYGLILPRVILEAPRLGCLNIHASLLPRWRGASPIQHAIWKGDQETGITIMQMDEGLDTGAMLARESVPIRLQTTAPSLHDELSALGAGMIVNIVNRLAGGEKIKGTAQDDSRSVYAPLLTKENGHVDWSQNAQEIDRQIRALHPWPGVWTINGGGKRIKIIEAELSNNKVTSPPGMILDHIGHIACGQDTALRLIKIQPENAKIMDAISAINGGYLKPEMILL